MKRLFIGGVMCLLLLLSLFIKNYVYQDTSTNEKNVKLNEYLTLIEGWSVVNDYLMEKKIADELRVDDFIHRTYSDGEHFVTLYIGYYFSSDKVGAAHHPLVCTVGQGWEVEKQFGAEKIILGDGIKPIEYKAMLSTLGERKELMAYWFQAESQPSISQVKQKIVLAVKKLSGEGEENAFVRFSTSCVNESHEECNGVLLNFIKSIYPSFLGYINDETAPD